MAKRTPKQIYDELERESEKMLALLKNRHEGLSTWHEFLNDRLVTVFNLTQELL